MPNDSNDFSRFQFHPVIAFPQDYEVYDFTQGYDANRVRKSLYGVGRYAEKRPGMYTSELFSANESVQASGHSSGSFSAPSSGPQKATRDIHMGVDLAAPLGTEVRAFYEGKIFETAIHSAEGDYGGTVITEHDLGGQKLWALYGHLSHKSVSQRQSGELVSAGDVLGWLGDKTENGGWNPHLHFQLSWQRPVNCDLPGAVSEEDFARACTLYPDPRLVLGPLWT